MKMGSTGPKEPEQYTPRESELLARVKSLEDDRLKFLDIVRIKLQKLEKELEVSVLFVVFFFFILKKSN